MQQVVGHLPGGYHPGIHGTPAGQVQAQVQIQIQVQIQVSQPSALDAAAGPAAKLPGCGGYSQGFVPGPEGSRFRVRIHGFRVGQQQGAGGRVQGGPAAQRRQQQAC